MEEPLPLWPEQRGVACSLCGRHPASGYAFINDDRYCHGDEWVGSTCYEQAQWTWDGQGMVHTYRLHGEF